MTNSVTFDFTDSTVLVTGGTSGIGFEVATRFVSAGANVIVTGTRSAPSDYNCDLSPFEFRQVEMRDAAAVLFLSSELSAFTTGSVLAVDGGFLAQ